MVVRICGALTMWWSKDVIEHHIGQFLTKPRFPSSPTMFTIIPTMCPTTRTSTAARKLNSHVNQQNKNEAGHATTHQKQKSVPACSCTASETSQSEHALQPVASRPQINSHRSTDAAIAKL